MKKILFLAIFIMAILMSSCSQVELIEPVGSNPSNVQEYNVTTRSSFDYDNMLRFESEAAFQSIVAQISSLTSTEDKMNWVKAKYGDFKSIQTVYWEAMNEVDESNDDSMESFELFQQKFKGLYFPKYMEDTGFYIPMTNLDAAYLVNSDCEISIGDKVINLRDIYDYETLMSLGRAYYSIEKPMMIGAYNSFNLNSTSMDHIGPEYESDWKFFKGETEDGTERKLKLKARRKFVTIPVSPISDGSESRVHLELCFRKKRWCGFTNYNGKSEMTFQTIIPGYGELGPLVFNHESYSSHDDEFPYPINIFNDGKHWYYTFEEVPFTVTVNFNKIKVPIVFKWNMYPVQCVTDPNGPHSAILPYF